MFASPNNMLILACFTKYVMAFQQLKSYNNDIILTQYV